MSSRIANKDVFSNLLSKKLLPYLANVFGLAGSAPASNLPPTASPDRALAAYLALSGLTCWNYTFTDDETQQPVTVLIVKPVKSSTIGTFRAIRVAPWMHNTTDLVKLFTKKIRANSKLHLINWQQQLSTPSNFTAAVEAALNLAGDESIVLSAPAKNEDLSAFTLPPSPIFSSG